MTTPEGVVKNKVKKLLKKFGSWYYMPVSCGYGKHGIPDFIACHNGNFIGVETKSQEKNLSPLQSIQRSEILASGGAYFKISCDKDLTDLEYYLTNLKHGV